MQQKNYLKGITSIRFLLAMLVLFFHANDHLSKYNIFWHSKLTLLNRGELAVEYFFVLSGFLLTYLAKKEFDANKKINIRAFFTRRVLRIFPLYYLAVIIGYFLLGFLYPLLMGKAYLGFSIREGLPYHLAFLPNWIAAKYPTSSGSLYGLWSIGVEEQFYLFFPFLISFLFKRKNTILLLGITTLIYLLLYYIIPIQLSSDINYVVRNFLHTVKFHFVFLGSLFALLYMNYYSFFEKIFSNKIYRIVIQLLFLGTLITNTIPFHINFICSIIFCIFFISRTFGKESTINLDHKYLVYLGQISFGIYIYHGIVSYVLRYFLEKNQIIFDLTSTFPLIYYISLSALTILVAHLSYQYYEKRFLKLKQKYTTK